MALRVELRLRESVLLPPNTRPRNIILTPLFCQPKPPGAVQAQKVREQAGRGGVLSEADPREGRPGLQEGGHQEGREGPPERQAELEAQTVVGSGYWQNDGGRIMTCSLSDGSLS